MSNTSFNYSPMEYASRPDWGKKDYDKNYNRTFIECRAVERAAYTAKRLKNPGDSYKRYLKEFESQLDIILVGCEWSSLNRQK